MCSGSLFFHAGICVVSGGLWGWVIAGSAPLEGPQKRSGEPSTGWFPLSVCSSLRGASRFFTGASPRAPAAF